MSKKKGKATHWKVWIEIEGLNKDGDTVESAETYEPIDVGYFESPDDAIELRDKLVDFVAGADRTPDEVEALVNAAKALLDDITDAEEDRHPETGEVFDTVARLRAALEGMGAPS